MTMKMSFTTAVFFAQFSLLLVLITAQNPTWLTLDGKPPTVIARGGFSGLFPDSSQYAYGFVQSASLNNTILWCDVHMTKDGAGICVPDLKLDNCTNIASIYPQGKNTYQVDGVNTAGWFVIDYSATELAQVSLSQPISSRIYNFDSSLLSILSVADVSNLFSPSGGFWLNVQNDRFYSQHNLTLRSYVLSVSKRVIVKYISSPDVAFLSSIAKRYRNSTTKLIFRFLDKGTEPTTNQTYESLLNNLTYIKSFASGILVPKTFIWRVSSDNYLPADSTSVVKDAHNAGLEVYAANLANDNLFSYNYSYDPVAECLSYIDNGAFSVDGLVADFPITPSEAIACYSHVNKNITDHSLPLIISHNGASGDYPDCTDLAYQKAVDDGADFIDCPVQVTEDLIAICMSNIDLIPGTTVTKSPYAAKTSSIPSIKQSGVGIFTFNLTWANIQTLKPVISNPQSSFKISRNPRNKNAGKFLTLSDFLKYAVDSKTLAGVLIYIEHAPFLADRLNYGVTDAIIKALSDAGYDNHTQEVMIESPDSSVLVKFKQQTKYKRIYKIDTKISDADAPSVADIKDFANAVAVSRDSIYPDNKDFITTQTDVVSKFHKAGLEVYVYGFQNEFVNQPWDFMSDPTVELNAHIQGAGVDGIFTDYPATARRYKGNSCNKLGDNEPSFMGTISPGGLIQLMSVGALPPALPPFPVLNVSDVAEAPLPAVSSPTGPSANGSSTPSPQPSSGQLYGASLFITVLIVFLAHFLV